MTDATAIILLAHGSRDPHWIAPFTQMLANVREQSPQNRVEMAYLEMAEPSLEKKIEELADAGFRQLEIIPLFFAAGKHLRKDVPLEVERMQARFQERGLDINVELHGPIGLEPEVATAISHTIKRKID